MPPEKLTAFNVRQVPVKVANQLTKLAASAGIKRERYLRKIFEMHVEQAAKAPKTPGRYVLEVPTHDQVVAALEAERAELDNGLELAEA